MSAVNTKICELKSKIRKIQNNYVNKMNFFDETNLSLIVDNNTNQWHSNKILGDGIKFKKICDCNSDTEKNNNLFLYNILEGHKIDKHVHTKEKETIICLSGMLRLIFSYNEHHILMPLESIKINKNMVHELEALQDSLFIAVFSPFS